VNAMTKRAQVRLNRQIARVLAVIFDNPAAQSHGPAVCSGIQGNHDGDRERRAGHRSWCSKVLSKGFPEPFRYPPSQEHFQRAASSDEPCSRAMGPPRRQGRPRLPTATATAFSRLAKHMSQASAISLPFAVARPLIKAIDAGRGGSIRRTGCRAHCLTGPVGP